VIRKLKLLGLKIWAKEGINSLGSTVSRIRGAATGALSAGKLPYSS